MKLLAALSLACLTWSATAGQVKAETVLERVQKTATLTCAASLRPGFAAETPAGNDIGLAVDLCRATAHAVAGPTAKIRMLLLDEDNDYVPLAQGAADLMFLTGFEASEHALTQSLIPGPTVFIDPITLMVPAHGPAQKPADLAGGVVCLMIGSPGQRALEARFANATPPIVRQAFSEDVELLDAYNVGRCDAAVGTTTDLAVMRLQHGINAMQSRILGEPLALVTIMAATPATDAAWASQIGWALRNLVASPAYAAMREKNLGIGSPLALPAWPNAVFPAGLLTPAGE